jgi:hypothetical protein
MADNKDEPAVNDSFLGGLLKEVEENPVRMVYLSFTSIYGRDYNNIIFRIIL